jgi:hypothetical protein
MSDFEDESLVARVNIPIPLPGREEILTALREQIPQVLKADVHAEITKLYTKGTFESIVEAAARDAFTKWLTEPDRQTGQSREDAIITRFHHFMTEEVAGPRSRQDYLIKVLLTAYPDLAKKLVEATPKKSEN